MQDLCPTERPHLKDTGADHSAPLFLSPYRKTLGTSFTGPSEALLHLPEACHFALSGAQALITRNIAWETSVDNSWQLGKAHHYLGQVWVRFRINSYHQSLQASALIYSDHHVFEFLPEGLHVRLLRVLGEVPGWCLLIRSLFFLLIISGRYCAAVRLFFFAYDIEASTSTNSLGGYLEML